MGDYLKFLQSEIEKLVSRLKCLVTEYSFLGTKITHLIFVVVVFELNFITNDMDIKFIRTIVYTALYLYCIYTIMMSIIKSILKKQKQKGNIEPEREFKCKEDEENVAYHEAGHAIIARISCKHQKLTNISIIPVGESNGRVKFDKKRDFYMKSDILAEIQFDLGGLVAEDIVYGEHSTGCYNDIKDAKEKAYYMLGDVAMGKHMVYNVANFKDVDAEVDEILKAERKKAEYILKKHQWILEKLKQELMVRKNMEAEEIDIFFLIHGI